MADEFRPSFLRSTWEGAKGAIKGLIAGGTFGAAVGAAGGAALAAMGFLGAIPVAAATGAVVLGGVFASVGAFSGTMTGVVRSREAATVPIEDAVKAVQVSLAQGMAIEQMRAQAMDGKWQEKIATERKQPTIDTGQRLHS